MVPTRSGKAVTHAVTSYGRASRKESAKQQRKNKRRRIAAKAAPDTRTTRSFAQLMQESDSEDDSLSSVLLDPESVGTSVVTSTTAVRVLRASTTPRRPRCTDFGRSRHYAFNGQGFLFCSPCDLWDSLPPDKDARMTIHSRRFACKANHRVFSHPTTLRGKQGCFEERRRILPQRAFSSVNASTSILQDEDKSCHSLSSTSTSSNAASVAVGTTDDIEEQTHDIAGNGEGGEHESLNSLSIVMALQVEVEKLKGKLLLLQERNRVILIENKALREAQTKNNVRRNEVSESTDANTNSTCSKNKAFSKEILDAINDVVTHASYRRWSDTRVGQLVAKLVWSHEKFIPHLEKYARKHFRDNVFTPFKILREMDLAGGTLSYEGMDVLRRVETCGVKRFRGSMIPSKSELKRMASVVEWYANEHCPFRSHQTEAGEAIQFDYTKATILCITDAFHLNEIGKNRSLSLASSIDGASLSKNLSIIAGGIKVTDRGARCPITSRPLLDNPFTMSAQSRNLCIPLKIMMGRETKETFPEFASLFKFLDNLSDAATLPVAMEGFVPFSCMTNCDLSAQWKGLGKGGAAKVHTLPCTGCATESDALAAPNATPCHRWCVGHSARDPDWLCFHKEMATPERMNSMKGEVEELVSTLERALVDILANSRMTRSDVEFDTPTEGSLNDVASIHCRPQTASQRQSLSRLFTSELILRGLGIDGTLEVRRERLWLALKDEATIARLSKEFAHGGVKEGAYFLLMQTLPCILHMENRNGIKILSMLLVEGLSNAKKKLLFTNVKAEGSRVSQFLAYVERTVNQSILGTPHDPCQWMCPFDSKKKELGPITMDNVRTRRIVNALLDKLLPGCVTDEYRKGLWTTAVNSYKSSMDLLRKKDDFDHDEVATYQHHADIFFQSWLRLWQKEGITNYIHMIGAGHVSDYLFRWKNLYRFSQQGWEAMNSLIKTFFFRRTNHGGGVRGETGKKSRLIPIARWLQRRMVHLCRTEEQAIRQYLLDHPMPSDHRTQLLSQEDIYE